MEPFSQKVLNADSQNTKSGLKSMDGWIVNRFGADFLKETFGFTIKIKIV